MPSLNPKDRAPLCLFSYEDGRRCRTPRIGGHPYFCFYHAQKESQSQATEKLAKDLAYFFSGNYLSANDLNSALARLIPAAIRGEIKPRVARTAAYMMQTLLQSIHLSQDEYINAFGTDGWRNAVHSSVTSNHDYLHHPDPNAACHPERSEGPRLDAAASTIDETRLTSAPAQSAAGSARPQSALSEACHPERSEGPWRDAASSTTEETRLASAPAQSAAAEACHPERSEGPRHDAAASTIDETRLTSARAQSALSEACHPERSEGPQLDAAASTTEETRLTSAPAQSAEPNNAPPPRPQPRPATPNPDPYAFRLDHTYRLLVDGKPF